MMATLQNYEESEKGTKKTFAPPTQKPHIVKPQPKSWKEETLGTSSPEAEAKPSRPKASSKKREQKTATEHGPSGGQEKKQKAQDKPAEKKGKSLQEKPTLTNAEFEEIFQSVLQKSLQECLGLGSGLNFAETSCAQPIIPTKSDREPGIAPSADNENADGEKVIVPDTPEIASSLEEEVSSETRTSKSGQPVTEPSKKKFNRLFSSKRKKKAEDEKIQDGHECSLKAKQKTMIQDHSQIRGQQKEEEGGFGQCLIWVQCSSPKCEKWRQLRGGIDPSVLPDNWSCDQNPDLNYNRCDIPEETWTGCESDVAYASYVPGSIIWAKQYGYPWWPGMIESDPDLGEYFLFASHLDSLPSKYHVTYFGETVSRAWIPVSMLKNFQELSLELARVKKCKNKDYGQKLEAAIRMAHKAEQISVQVGECPAHRLGPPAAPQPGSVFPAWPGFLMPKPSTPFLPLDRSGLTCLVSGVDTMDLTAVGKGKDPTLPRPKPAKIQTKKTKSRGPKKKFKTPESKASATELPKEKAIKTDSKCPAPPAPHGACPLGKEGPGPQEPLTQEAASFPPEDDGSSDLDLEQLMEDIGEAEERGESQQRDGSEEFLAGLFEE
nr:zinc finger CW-type PWWP domain protein 1 isoform X5 [Peromyscus maniculatus bairdii]